LRDAKSSLNPQTLKILEFPLKPEISGFSDFLTEIYPVQPESSVLRGPSGVQSVCKSIGSTSQFVLNPKRGVNHEDNKHEAA